MKKHLLVTFSLFIILSSTTAHSATYGVNFNIQSYNPSITDSFSINSLDPNYQMGTRYGIGHLFNNGMEVTNGGTEVAVASAKSSYNSIGVYTETQTTNNYISAYATAFANDEIVISNSSYSGPLYVQWRWNLSGTLESANGYSGMNIELLGNSPNNQIYHHIIYSTGGINPPNQSINTTIYSDWLQFNSGDLISFYYSMYAYSVSSAYSSCKTDFMNTLELSGVNILSDMPTDSFSISSNSGYNYNFEVIPESGTQPVPEPSTMLLLGSGLVGLVGYGRKRLMK